MQVFKCAVKLALRRPIFFIVYGLFLSMMGVFMALAVMSPSTSEEYQRYDLEYALIDRDHSAVSEGLGTFMEQIGVQKSVEDTDIALQDAVAKGEVAFIVIVPEGYGEQFVLAARNGEELPQVQTVYSYYSAEGSLADAAVSNYVSVLNTALLADPDASPKSIVEQALSATDANAEVKTLRVTNSTSSESEQFAFYLQFDMYVYFAGIIVCVGLMLTALNRTDVRRRNLSSPVSYLSYNAQVFAASIVIMLLFWVLTIALGAIFFPESLASIGVEGILLMAAITLSFAMIPLGVAFLLGQLGLGETLINATGNLLGLILSFLGGAWVSMDLMSPEVNTIAHFLPGFWYTDALSQAGNISNDPGALAAIGVDIGVLLLFALAAFCVALVVGRLRMQTSEAGGNAAATDPA